MRFYVAGHKSDHDNPRIAAMMQVVRDAGHVITHDWIAAEDGLDTTSQQRDNIDMARTCAHNDIQGVMTADVVVVDTSNTYQGKGMYVELGAAIATAELCNIPWIFLVGKLNHATLFFHHPRVRIVDNIHDVLEAVGG